MRSGSSASSAASSSIAGDPFTRYSRQALHLRRLRYAPAIFIHARHRRRAERLHQLRHHQFASGSASRYRTYAAKNAIGSATLTIQKRNFRFDSEFAYAGTDFDRRDATGICPVDQNGITVDQPCDSRLPQVNLGYQNDWGGRAEAQYRYGRLTLRGSFVRFQPNFASINARQVADLQDALARISVDAANWLTVDGTFRRSNNDLREQLPFETIQRQPEGRLIFHDLSFMKRGVFEMGYRQRFVNASDDSIDRYVRMPYAEFSFPISTTFLTVGYERRQAVDIINQSQTSNTNRYYVGLRGVYDFGGWHINPSFRYELERQSQRPDLDTPSAIDPLRLDYDSNRLGTATLLVEAPKWFIVEVAFRDSSATIYGPTGYSRPALSWADHLQGCQRRKPPADRHFRTQQQFLLHLSQLRRARSRVGLCLEIWKARAVDKR